MKNLRWLPPLLLGLILLVLLLQPRWYLNLVKRTEVSAASGARLVAQYGCRKCHLIHGEGALKGPDLDQQRQTADLAEWRRWLTNPKRVKPNTPMPNFHLSDSEIEAILLYLTQE